MGYVRYQGLPWKPVFLLAGLGLSLAVVAVSARLPWMQVRPEVYLDLYEDEPEEPQLLPWPLKVTLTVLDHQTGALQAGPVSSVTSVDVIEMTYVAVEEDPGSVVENATNTVSAVPDLGVQRLECAMLIDPVLGNSIDLKGVFYCEMGGQGQSRSARITTSAVCTPGRDTVVGQMGRLDFQVLVEWQDR
jgi:hypothetical protein